MMGCLKANQSTYNQTSLYDRIKKLLVSYDWSDCSFSVSGKNFKTHKLILAISSPVFEAMFYGPLSSTDNIEVTDIQPDIFQLLLNYIYTDTVEISTIEEAFELLYASKKYLLEHLSELCIAHIKSNISVDNVIEVLNYPEYMQDTELLSYSLQLFCEHAHYLLQEKKSLITYSCLKAILESDQMNIAEKDLIKHVFEWSSYCCEQNNILATFENRREILNEKGLFKLLRFLSLSVNELKEIVTDYNNLLLPYEFENIMDNIKSPHKTDVFGPMGLSHMPRHILQLQWHHCYRCPVRSVAPIVIDSNNYIIQSRIMVNKSVFINSLCVPTRMAPADNFCNKISKAYTEQLTVSVMCESDNNDVKFTKYAKRVDYDSMIEIPLREPCFVKKNEWYKVSFIWPNNRSLFSYVVELRHRHYNGHKVSFEFDDVPFNAGTNGSFLGGLKFCL